MTVYKSDVLRPETGETGLAIALRNRQTGYATDTFKMIHKFEDGTIKKYIPEDQLNVFGMTGIKGELGDQGATGIQGETGTGIQGTTGLPGAAGNQGVTGAQGFTGLQGTFTTSVETGTFNMNITGCATGANEIGVVNYMKFGPTVHLRFNQIYGYSKSTALEFYGLPAALSPTELTRVCVPGESVWLDNDTQLASGSMFALVTDDYIKINKEDGTTWSATGDKGLCFGYPSLDVFYSIW